MPTSDEILTRVRLFLEDLDKDTEKYGHLEPEEMMVFGDVWMLLGLAEANTTRKGNQSFLESANRGVQGWKRANTNQIEIIGRLQQEIKVKLADIRNLEERVLVQRREINALKEEASNAQDWQNEVASLIPEDAEGINPEGAQEGIILDYIKYLQSRVQDAYRQGVERGLAGD